MQSNESRCDGKDSCLTHHPRPAAAFASCPRACIHYIQLSSRRPIRYANLSMNKYFSSFHFPSTSGASPLPCRNSPHLSNLSYVLSFGWTTGSGGSKFLPLCKSPKIFLSDFGPDFLGVLSCSSCHQRHNDVFRLKFDLCTQLPHRSNQKKT